MYPNGHQQSDKSTNNLHQQLDVDFALQAAGLGIWDYDSTTGQIYWDERARSLFGLSADNYIPYEEALQHIHPDDVQRVDEAVQWALNPQSGGVYNQTYRTIGIDDQQLRWVCFQGKAYFTSAGQVTRFAGIAQDVTEQTLARQQLEQAQQQLLTQFEQAPVGIATISGTNLVFGSANAAYCHLVGRSPEQLIGHSLLEAIPELQDQGFDTLLRKVMASGQPYTAQEVPTQLIRGGHAETAYFTFTYQPHWLTDGTMSGVLTVATEVTNQVLARQQLQASEARFRLLIEEAPLATSLFLGRELRVAVANEPMLAIWGKGPDQVGRLLADILPEIANQPFLAILDDVYTTGQTYSANGARADLVINGVPGTYYFDFIYKPLFDTNRQVYGILQMASDVTEQVLAQRHNNEMQEEILTSFEQAPVAIALFEGADLTFRVANPFYAQLMGRAAGQLLGKPMLEAVPEMAGQGFDTLLHQVIASGQPYRTWETAVGLTRQEKAEVIYLDFTYQPRRRPDGQITGVLVIASDVTQQVAARRELEESEARYRTLSVELDDRVQARTQELQLANQDLRRSNDNLQQFAYIASHDLQEPLRKIQSFGDLLQTQYGETLGDGTEHLRRMQTAAHRMSVLISDLLTFSRISTNQVAEHSVALSTLVDQVLENLSVAIEESRAQIDVADLPTVPGSNQQLSQLFQNLLSNALKFRQPDLPPQIRISSQRMASTDLPVSVKLSRPASACVRINVADNGIGFDEKYLDRIFQVFQRLHGKSQYSGTGIGLAICEKVVANHGGAITASSQPGRGATFSVYLPV